MNEGHSWKSIPNLSAMSTTMSPATMYPCFAACPSQSETKIRTCWHKRSDEMLGIMARRKPERQSKSGSAHVGDETASTRVLGKFRSFRKASMRSVLGSELESEPLSPARIPPATSGSCSCNATMSAGNPRSRRTPSVICSGQTQLHVSKMDVAMLLPSQTSLNGKWGLKAVIRSCTSMKEGNPLITELKCMLIVDAEIVIKYALG
eukprot:4665552-Amphidinium_carterae.1